MAQPGEIIGMAGTAFIEGRLEAMSERYLYPFVVAMDEHHHIVRTPEELIEMLGVLRADLMANGMTDARTRIESQMVFNEELAFVSAETIYNEMRATRPDLLALLFDPIATDRRGEVPEGMEPYMTIPPFSWHDGRLTVFYQRQYIDSAQRFPDAMRLTPEHVEALDFFDELANDPDLHIKMRLIPGDMQFVYNHAQLHDLPLRVVSRLLPADSVNAP